MRRSCPHSLRAALAGLALGALPCTAPYSVHGQDTSPQAVSAGDTAKRVQELNGTIVQRIDAGRFAEAIPPAREKLDLLERTRGTDHWETGDARRDLESLQRTTSLPLEVRERVIKARQASARARQLQARGQYIEAAQLFREALSIHREVLGEDHPNAATSLDSLAGALLAQGNLIEAEPMLRQVLATRLKVLGEDHPYVAISYNNLATTLRDRRKFTEAEAMARKALAIDLKALGEDHPDIAIDYNYLVVILLTQGKFLEAEAMARKALAIDLKALGEDHPNAVTSYNNLSVTLHQQGKVTEAEATNRHVLAIRIKALGEDHHDTATSYNNLAAILRQQDKFTEAEAMLRRALATNLKALGEDHPDTATGYNNLATILNDQGRHTEAETMLRRALAIQLKVLGEDHPATANGYNNLATTLDDQGRHAEAETMLRRALDIRLKALGEDHPATANGYNNLATTLRMQGKSTEAEAMVRHSLAIRRKALGEDHPATANGYNNLATNLNDQGKFTEAEAMLRRALAINLKALGEDQIEVALNYSNLAHSLGRQGKCDEALRIWTSAATSYEQARLRGAKGLEAALTTGNSPLPHFAIALARAGRPRDAWTRWEQGLARSLADELSGRAARSLTAVEHDREANLLGQAQSVEERVSKLRAFKALSQEQDQLLDDLKRQESELRRQLLELEQQFESKYGALVGRPAMLEAAQKAIPEGTALIGWIDQSSEHWVCLLRHYGDPVWVRLSGSGKDGAWTKEEQALASRLRAELNPETTSGNARRPAEALAQQRLEPLKEHLKGTKRLVVVNSPGMAGVPVEVLLTARPDPAWSSFPVSYAPSASMFTHVVGKPTPRDRPPTLLALADPAYPKIKDNVDAHAPPDAGLVIARIIPNGNADLNGIQAGDVLIAYAQTTLNMPADLKIVAPDTGPKKVPVRSWRAGITRNIEVAAGPLGVVIDPRPVKAAVLARQAADQVLLEMRGGSQVRLPGTRREIEAVARLFPTGAVSTVMGEQACESTVQNLARSGRMKGFRYLHFATHGESDPRHAYRSALILAPDPDRAVGPRTFDSDGMITAEQIARTWELDADLVVLSACESGLGRAAGGEGYLGFAQPLFAKGARSLVLSLWKVDDDATALLMVRFYQNLLGRRTGLKTPLPKTEALAEAKAWLRSAGPEDVGQALAALPRGDILHRPVVEAVMPKTSVSPYKDPTYWAGFILVGSPD